MNGFFLYRKTKIKIISYILMFAQILFPVALTLGPTMATANVQTPQKIDEQQYSSSERWLAQQTSQAGSILSSNDPKNSASQLLINQANSAANQEIEKWLSQYGKARINLGLDKDFSLKNTEAEVFIPFFERDNFLLFNQTSFHRTYDRNQGNLGFGIRMFNETQLTGFNTFYDRDFTGNNSRLGFGLEYRRDYLSLSSNYYQRLTNWKESSVVKGFDERPANGWDLRSQAYLPAYPQLGMKVNFEQYYGDNVDLFNDSSKRQKDPYSVTAGLNYTPVPLITMDMEHKAGKGGANNSYFGVSVNYQFGTSLDAQLDPSRVNQIRLLANSKYDFVDRNNNIVFDYRERYHIRLVTPDFIEGRENEQKMVNVAVDASDGLDYISINANEFLAHGGRVVSLSPTQYLVTMPYYDSAKDADNTYNVTAIAYDNKGRASSVETTRLVVINDKSEEQAFIAATPDLIGINESSVITLQIKDNKGNNTKKDDALIVKDSQTKGILSETTYNESSKTYQATFVGLVAESAHFYAYFDGDLHEDVKATVKVQDKAPDFSSLTLTADKNEITVSHSTKLRLTLFDKNGQPVKVDDADILLSDSNTGYISETVYDETSKQYLATFTGTIPTKAEFHPSIDNNLDTDTSAYIDVITFKDLNLNTVKEMYVGETIDVDLTLLDETNQPMKDDSAEVQLAGKPDDVGDGHLLATLYHDGDKTHRAKFTATKTGTVTFNPYVSNVLYDTQAKQVLIKSLDDKYTIVTMTADPDRIWQNQTSKITVQINEGIDKPLEGGNVVIVLDNGAGTIGDTAAVPGKPGYYEATYYGDEPTKAHFVVTIDGHKDNNAQAIVTVLSAQDLIATLSANKSQIDLNDPADTNAMLNLQIVDKVTNQPIDAGHVTIRENQPYKGLLSNTSENSTGNYSAPFVANVTGIATFNAYINGDILDTNTVNINIINNKSVIDFDKTTIDANPKRITADAQSRTSVVTLSIRDQFNNLFDPEESVNIVIAYKQHGQIDQITRTGVGTYTVNYTPVERDSEYTELFHAVINDIVRQDIETQVVVEPAKHNVTDGVSLHPDPNEISISETSMLKAYFYNAFGERIIPSGKVEIRFADGSTNQGTFGILGETTQATGDLFEAPFVGQNVGKQNFQVYLDGTAYTQGNSTTSVNVSEDYQLSISANPGTIETGDTSLVSLEVRNHKNELIQYTGDVQIMMQESSSTTPVGVVVGTTTFNPQSKIYTIQFKGLNAGTATFAPSLDDEVYVNVKTQVNVTMAPAYKTGDLSTQKPEIQVGQQSFVYLNLVDKNGNKVEVDDAQIVLDTPSLGFVTQTYYDKTNQRYTALFNGRDVGNAIFSAIINGEKASGLTASINVIDDPNAFYNSSLTPEPDTVKVNNTSLLTLKLYDRTGNPIQIRNTSIVLVNNELGVISKTTWNDKEKAYQATFTGLKAGDAEFIALVNDKNAGLKANVTVINAFNSSSIIPKPSKITTGEQSEVTLTLYDANKKPLRIDEDNVRINLLNGELGTIGATTFDSKSVTYKATFTGNVVGLANFNASINDTTYPNIQTSVTVTKLFETASLTPNPDEIDISDTSKLTLLFKDNLGNNVSVGTADIVLAKPNTGALQKTTYDAGSKTYSADFTGTVAGDIVFYASVNGKINTSITATVKVNEVKVPTYSLQIASDPTKILLNQTSRITLKLTDEQGHLTQADDVKIVSKTGNYGKLSDTSYDAEKKEYFAIFTGLVVGQATFYPVVNAHYETEPYATVDVEKLNIIVPSMVTHYTGNDSRTFSASGGYPHVASKEAEFELSFYNALKDYTWSSNNANVIPVKSDAPRFRFTNNPGVGKEVTLVGVSNSDPTAPKAVYTFIINKWFVPLNKWDLNYKQAKDQCAQIGAVVPTLEEVYVTGNDYNTLKGEWGNLTHFPASSKWNGAAFWLDSPIGATTSHYTIQPDGNNSYTMTGDNTSGRNGTCVYRGN